MRHKTQYTKEDRANKQKQRNNKRKALCAAELIAFLVAGASNAVAVTLIVGLSTIAVILIDGVSTTLLQNIQEQLLNKRLIILYKFVYVWHVRRKNDRVYKKRHKFKIRRLNRKRFGMQCRRA